MNKKATDLNILVIGLGSMGKRRIRNLKANGVSVIAGFDLREDRRKETEEQYEVKVYSDFEDAVHNNQFDAWIISVPPDMHHIYMKRALQLMIPAFIEASVVDTDMEAIINDSAHKGLVLAPSCTLYFHPAIQKISGFIRQGVLGKLSNILYHSGQYLPDWHTYEKVSEYYVSKKETGGAREIVPFEMTWITLMLGFPVKLCGMHKKTIQIEGAEFIDDTYNLLMDYNTFMINLCVDVVSRAATRRMVINGEDKQLYWDWNDNVIKIYDPEKQQWEEIKYEAVEAHSGYNKNITETMYNKEIEAFLDAVTGNSAFPNNLQHDHRVLKLLYKSEKSFVTNSMQDFS
jgi:predicted dehydrogenase